MYAHLFHHVPGMEERQPGHGESSSAHRTRLRAGPQNGTGSPASRAGPNKWGCRELSDAECQGAVLAAGAVPALCAVADAEYLATRAGERRVSNRWSRIEAALSDEINNDSLRGRSVCCIAVCVSAWCQLSSVCLPGASWALTLATVSIWLSTGACCVPYMCSLLVLYCAVCS